MDLYLIRHGQTVANLEGRFAGWGDTPLTELGENQARAVGERLRGIRFDQYYCSDLHRAKQTFRCAFGEVTPCTYCADIREANSGSLRGKLIKEVRAAADEDTLSGLMRWDYTPYQGENAEIIRARVGRFLDAMAALQGVERVAAVTHGGALQAMASLITGSCFPQTPMIVENCSVSVLTTRKNGAWVIKRWNVTDEL